MNLKRPWILARRAPLVTLLLLAACAGTESGTNSVTLRLHGPELDASASQTEDVLFAGSYSTAVPVDNPAPALGTLHQDDAAAQERIDAFMDAAAGATQLLVHQGDPTLMDGPAPHFELSGCVPNEAVLAELERLGGQVCDPEELGRSIGFANVQLARVAPDGPYHIYEDYVIQTLPLFLDVGGCLGGAWQCEEDGADFDGIFVPSYPSSDAMLQVASETGSSGPGGAYGDATYSDLRYGGVEIIVRNLLDTHILTPDSEAR